MENSVAWVSSWKGGLGGGSRLCGTLLVSETLTRWISGGKGYCGDEAQPLLKAACSSSFRPHALVAQGRMH
jgi:hypothetical protein